MSNEAEHGSQNKSSQDTIEINNSRDSLPVVEVLTGRGVVLGKSGSGKSNSASVVVEELLEDGYPVLIVDVDGEYFGLKEEYELLHLGADEECDLVVGPEHAEKIAELTLEQNIPVILDVSGYLHEEKQKELIKEVGRHLFAKEKKLKKPFLMLVEEIHEYIPEAGLDDVGKMLIKVAKRGRKHGLGLCGISQRPADIKKDFITQCDWHIWHRLTWDNDTKVVRRVLGSEYADNVQDLDDGEAFLLTDWDDQIRCVQFRRKHTFDAGATPGLEEIERPDLKSVSEDIISELEVISEKQQAKTNELERLHSKLEEREERISQLEEDLEKSRDLNKLAERFTEALAQSDSSSDSAQDLQATVDEIREEKNEEIEKLRKENQRLREENRQLRNRVEQLTETAERVERFENLDKNIEEIAEAYIRMGEALGLDPQHEEAERLRKRVDTLRDTVGDLREDQVESTEQDTETEISTYREFLKDQAVQDAITAAKKEASSPRYVEGVITAVIAENQPVTYDQIAKELGISSTGHVASAVNALYERDIVTKSKDGRVTKVDLNIDQLDEIRATAQRRETSLELISSI
jgi:DNA-binding transcriptional regulator GbsR (MarR family)